ncbi:hypothetical protein GCM10009678_09640 [Actinomadura kijaniata]|uniref:Uncharacterized protein n=1 Tax=Actinomadura namibiensis TaxID=182080 RepID=A0A7W3LJH5_ACTNM|nr:hypothetical protein [Actinomadura namibiensis]MBA8949296.1 hypothetical protein [Actinomadura namibiensis]
MRTTIAAAVLTAGALALAGGSAHAAQPQAPSPAPSPTQSKEAHVTGDAWVRYSVDPQNPLRRFVFDAHGQPFKVADGKIVFGAARGTVRFDHPGPNGEHNWGTVNVDYVMTGGPVAVVSGTSPGGLWPKGARMTFTVHDDPRGDRYDRMGFSWGVVDPRCAQMDMGPAPFTSYVSGKGYRVQHAELPAVPEGTQGPDKAPTCVNADLLG